ncbi:3-methyl-2-oxobutanoate hydroxymethyltransferase [Pusillimonas caeni]|uniref:3-methyl-2-oxobutanoate hydroxymethyltransferase n=1 Tax=Pusillimonas caeni TaxID=1348472 RepID=UPI000E59FEF6|nr:3-methyl-2-oxobutanoate hydroxymethyltransferase [Pusillimonas caeni]TFL13033.1 3-methyl-2-oxobutanoate hydroxymethyltransferase [Pusillimonas caeni]
MKLTDKELLSMKSKAQIPILTAYTTPIARCVEQAGVSAILVGDTVGMVEMGFSSTRYVTMEHMIYHIGAVRRGAPDTHIIGDMPFNSDLEPDSALRNARLLVEAGADSVKLEGPKYDVIRHLVAQGIPVVGHTGLTPQTAQNFRQVGKDAEDARRLLQDAMGIADAGAFMVVLEHIPDSLAARITAGIPIPTIGIGAGTDCDGQVLVINDAIGMGEAWPPFSRQYAYVGQTIIDATRSYVEQVEARTFK